MASIAVVFPGQGSQYVGMGQAWHHSSPAAREIFAQAEEKSGLPIRKLCFEGPLEELTLTKNLQPAVTAVDLACWAALQEAGIRPIATAGHSMGEYPALAACGALSLGVCLEMVSLRGRLMDREANAKPGAMAAIMGASPQEAASLCAEAEGVVQPANFNTPAQTVITGAKDAVAEASRLAKEKNLKVIPLKVSGAWHSPLMQRAAREMEAALDQVDLAAPECLHVPNSTGEPTQDPDAIMAELKKQLISPVRWVQTIEALAAQGVDTFIEAGPKKVLTGLIRKTIKGVNVVNVAEPDDIEKALSHAG